MVRGDHEAGMSPFLRACVQVLGSRAEALETAGLSE
jgi:hypothetical protein